MSDNPYLNKLSGFDDRIAVIGYDGVHTYRELIEEISAMVNFLKESKVNAGEVTAVLSDYSFKSIALFFALFENRNVIVPITSTVKNEIDEKLREAYADKSIEMGPGTLKVCQLTSAGEHDFIRRLKDKNRSGLILFSSGSTGKPKAMLHDLDGLIDIYPDKKSKQLRILVFLMFDHIGGLNTLLNTLSIGATLVIPESRDPAYICGLIERHKINILPSSPTFLNLIVMSGAYQKHDLSSLNLITYGTEPMPESLLTRLKTIFPKVKFLQTFGTSETGIARTSSKSSTSTLLKIDDPNVTYKIVDGELWLRSKTQVLGYLNANMDNFKDNGWYMTGDLVEEAGDGYLKIIGRTKEVINVGGQKVVPEEVEAILMEMPSIADCMVYGEHNSITGQIVAVDIVLKNPEDRASIRKEIRKYCAGKLDTYKNPAKINIVERTNYTNRYKKIRLR